MYCTRSAGAFLLCLTLTAALPVRVQEAPPDLADPGRIESGQALFEGTCATCHGSGGTGDAAPILRGRSWEPNRLWAIVHDGAGLAFMPKFSEQLTDDEIWSVIAYVMSVSASPPERREAGGRREEGGPTLDDLPQPLVGDPGRGRELFRSSTATQACAACHRFQGEGSPEGRDLSGASSRSPAALFRSLLLAHPELAENTSIRGLLDLVSFLESKPETPARVTVVDIQARP